MIRLAFMLCFFSLFSADSATATGCLDHLEPIASPKGDVTGTTAGPASYAKLDENINQNAQEKLRIFVRFKDQLFRRGGDYEAFVEQHRHDKRSRLRPMVLNRLRAMSDRSWQRIVSCVKELEDGGRLSDVQRYWIVNGFACKATGQACRVLAALKDVEFVYLQRGPARQERIQASDSLNGNRMQRLVQWAYDQAIKNHAGDSEAGFSLEGLEIPWNIRRIRADEVWRQEKIYGRGVIVAVNDEGIAVTPAIARALWRNTREELNGIDDDGNGHVDDLFGYNFRLDHHFVLLPSGHATACAGIIAGRPLNKIRLATGIAPRARLMSLVGSGYLRACEYALANGADIISLSFMFIRPDLGHYRGLYRLAHEHLSAAGVLAVGGAGNFGPGGQLAMPEGKQIATPKDIPCVVAAAGITRDGIAPGMSSRGPCTWSGVKFYNDFPPDQPLRKPDVTGCSGGYPVWWVLPSSKIPSRWKIVSQEASLPFQDAESKAPLELALVEGPSGNSFSGPHVAGVAALMLSANPELNPWEVKALIEQTCRDLGKTGWDPVYGAGLIDALAAVRAAKKVVK